MTRALNYDTLVVRLSHILFKLNQGQKLEPHALAEEFGVNVRTIQRDLNDRFSYLPLQKMGGKYFLDPSCLGKMNGRDIEKFAALAGVQGLFPSLTEEFLKDIFDIRMQSAFLVKGHDHENLKGKEHTFRELELAITERRLVDFSYEKNSDVKFYKKISPYKLLNHKGIWYLVAVDNDQIKTYVFAKIKAVILSECFFDVDQSLMKEVEGSDGIYFGNAKKEIVLKVDNEVAYYFKRRKILPNQVIDEELDDGGLIVSSRTSDDSHLMAIVRYWIPHLKIISPKSLANDFDEIIRSFLVCDINS